jgi:hypothetical protein
MNQAASTSQPPQSASGNSLRTGWFSPRRKRFWAWVLLLLYTVIGFFALPPLLESLAVSALRDSTGREAVIEQIRVNPYVLSVEVNGFALSDTDGAELAGFDRLFVNFQLSSLFNWALTFREFSVDDLRLLFERFAPGDSRLTRLLADIDARAEPAAADQEPGGLPRLLVHDIRFSDGRARLRDEVPDEPVELELGPVDVSMQDLSTIPDRYGQQSVRVGLPQGAALSWQGNISLAPLESSGSLELTGSRLEQTTAYLKAILPLESFRGVLSVRTDYRIAERDDGSLEVALDRLEGTLADIAASGLTPTAEFLAFSSLALAGGSLRYPENTLHLSNITLTDPALVGWLDENGEPSLMQLVPQTAEPAADDADAAADAGPGWRISADEFSLSGGRIDFSDRSIEPSAEIRLETLGLTLKNLSNEEGARMPVSATGSLAGGGAIGFDGELSVLPDLTVAGAATLDAIPLQLAEAYARQVVNLRIESGTLESAIDLELLPAGSLEAAGRLAVDGLNVLDGRDDQPLVGWKRFETDRFELDSAAPSVKLSRLAFREPFGRLIVNEDRSTNLGGLAVDNAAQTDEVAGESDSLPDGESREDRPDETTGDARYSIVIGGVEVIDGALDFSDLSLPLPFATEIRKLGGTISTIATGSTEPANVKLEGRVDEYGLARISGGIQLLDPLRYTDITMEFRNLLMSSLSPYSIQFAGQKIDEGKLDLDLRYQIDNGQLLGQNDIVMSDLMLGEKVEHPDAADLPLGLAVALLKDANGVIDIDLPVEGDVNDPQFQIGGVIWQAFVGLVTKIVTAPFRLLGGLVGADADDIGQFQFLAGRSDLAPPEIESIGQLREALAERPELTVEVSGPYVVAVDTPALQYKRLRDEVFARIGEPAAADEDVSMLDEDLISTLEAIFTERFPAESLETVKAAHQTVAAGENRDKPEFDMLAYGAALRDRLLATEEIGQADLEQLADLRARAIQDAFLADGAFDSSRIRIVAPAETESEDGEWVMMELGLAAD